MKIEIKGAIISDGEQWIYDWFEIPACSPGKVNKLLDKADGKDVEVIMNSGGGSVFAGSEIYTSLKDYKGKTTGKIVGLAGSACSVIAMGVDDLQISPTGQIMIHRASIYTGGNKNDIEKTIEMLDGTDKAIANSYLLKTGIDQATLLDMMDKETWLNAQKAKELGFVDSIMFDEGNKLFASVEVDKNGLLPQAVIDKMRNEFKGKTLDQKQNNNEVDNHENLENLKAKLLLELEL